MSSPLPASAQVKKLCQRQQRHCTPLAAAGGLWLSWPRACRSCVGCRCVLYCDCASCEGLLQLCRCWVGASGSWQLPSSTLLTCWRLKHSFVAAAAASVLYGQLGVVCGDSASLLQGQRRICCCRRCCWFCCPSGAVLQQCCEPACVVLKHTQPLLHAESASLLPRACGVVGWKPVCCRVDHRLPAAACPSRVFSRGAGAAPAPVLVGRCDKAACDTLHCQGIGHPHKKYRSVCKCVFCGVAVVSYQVVSRLSCRAAHAAGRAVSCSAPFLPSLCLVAPVQLLCAVAGCQSARLCGSPPPCEVGCAAVVPSRCLLQWPVAWCTQATCVPSEVLIVAVSAYSVWYRIVSVVSARAFCYVYCNQGVWFVMTFPRCFPLTYWFGCLEALKCSSPSAEPNYQQIQRCCLLE